MVGLNESIIDNLNNKKKILQRRVLSSYFSTFDQEPIVTITDMIIRNMEHPYSIGLMAVFIEMNV